MNVTLQAETLDTWVICQQSLVEFSSTHYAESNLTVVVFAMLQVIADRDYNQGSQVSEFYDGPHVDFQSTSKS